jgi:multiple RNA-binding domain-containing protein 1
VSLPVDEPMLNVAEKVDLADQPATTVESTNAPNATDDDWLRSRTSRLLDLVDVNDLPVVVPTQNIPALAMSSSAISALIPEPAVQVEDDFEGFSDHGEAEETTADIVDPTIEAIKASGRLFVRNLPYTATEDDLRKHFEKYGAVEEVRAH